MEEALTESIRERQELERKLSKLSKTMDYFERAKRERERPLLLEAFKQRQQDDEVYYNQQQEVRAFSSHPQLIFSVPQLGRFSSWTKKEKSVAVWDLRLADMKDVLM